MKEEVKKITVSDLKKTESSNVYSVAYQEDVKKTFVTFKNGSIYEYENVKKEDFEKLKNAKSTGSYLSTVFLKNNYDYKKLENVELDYTDLKKENITK